MATFNEIIYNILNINRDGQIAAEEPINKEQVLYWCNYYRSIIIKKELDKKRALDNNLVQNLKSVEVIKVDRDECCHIQSGCTVYRTKNKLPSVAGGDQEMFTYVGSLDKKVPFNVVNRSYTNWIQYSRYGKKGVYAYYTNDYLYIDGYPFDLKHINIQGVFDNPLDAINFIECENDCSLGLDADYPVPGWMLQVITEQVMRKELTFMATRTIDNENNFKPAQTDKDA